MSTTGPNIGIKHSWSRGLNGWNTENDANLRALDALVQSTAVAQQNAPPGSPADGDTYLVGTSPTGAWAGHANAFARYNAAATAWEFWTPRTGWVVRIGNAPYSWNGTVWTTDLSIGGKLTVNGSDRILSDGSGLFSSLYSSALPQNAIPRSSNASGLLASGSWIDTGSALSTSSGVTLSGTFQQLVLGATASNAGALLLRDGSGVPNGFVGWDGATESVRLAFQNSASSGKIVFRTRISGAIGDRFVIDTDGSVTIASAMATFRPLFGSLTWGSVYATGVTPSAANFVMSWAQDGTVVALNAATGAGQIGISINNVGIIGIAATQISFNKQIKIGDASNLISGGGTATLGTNCPATTLYPQTWLRIVLSDGSMGYLPIWKN